MPKPRRVAPALVLALAFLSVGRVWAHDPGLSSVQIVARGGAIDAEIVLSVQDVDAIVPLDSDGDLKASRAEIDAARERLEELGRGAVEITLAGRVIPPTSAQVAADDSGALHFHLRQVAPLSGRLVVRGSLLARLPRGHRQYVAVRDADGRLLGERLLRADDDLLALDLGPDAAAESPWRSSARFLRLGVEHILTGYDHLAFLLALLVVGGSLRTVLKIITSFTLAHSITLALAALGVVRLSPHIVEPVIAASIVYVAFENILRSDLRRRYLLTFGFGLVHGLGFASALREAGLGAAGAGVALPLASFNLGVELGQVAVVAVALPLVWRLGRAPSLSQRLVPACSVVIAVAGATWLVARLI